MKIAIAYCSKHRGNTKKILNAMCQNADITWIDVTKTNNQTLDEYDIIGFASGIYYSNFHKAVIGFAKENLPANKKVFFVYTCGAAKNGYTDTIKKVVTQKNATILGEYGCLGFDTFGPFKLIGGIAKDHPTAKELADGAAFFRTIIK